MLATGIILYWVGTGFCEAYAWVKGLPIALKMVRWYHLVRLISQAGLLMAIFSYDTQFFRLCASWVVGWLLYEIIINLVVTRRPFVNKTHTFPVIGIQIPFPWWITPAVSIILLGVLCAWK